MTSNKKFYYALAPGVEIIPLDENKLLFRSDTLAIKLDGRSTKFFLEKIVPLINGSYTLREIVAQVPQVPAEELEGYLKSLVNAGVIRHIEQAVDSSEKKYNRIGPFLALIDNLGLSPIEIQERLAKLKIAIVGLEAHGSHLASLLSQYGVGQLTLLDPGLVKPGHLSLASHFNFDSLGLPRQEALKAKLDKQSTQTEIVVNHEEITIDTISSIAANVDMLVGCFDKGFISTNYWINEASLKHNIPSIYGEIREHIGFAGPLVLPEQSACYMCYRMRSIANSTDYELAMSYEEFLDQKKEPTLHLRPIIPSLPPFVASLVATEMINLLLGLSQPTLADQIMSFNALTLQTQRHPILHKPDCPVCRQKKNWVRNHLDYTALSNKKHKQGNPLAAAPYLISKQTGIVQNFQILPKNKTEPFLPYIVRAQLGNHQFRNDWDENNVVASGKGVTLDAAKTSALGEAVERYSSSVWVPEEIHFAKRCELKGPSLDPNELVLYLPEQYEHLNYVPYSDDKIIGWVQAYSLVSEKSIFVPATAVFMNYEARYAEEYIAQMTSNGLATGPTLLDAIINAAEEVLERDAFTIFWLNRLEPQRIDPWTLPDKESIILCNAYQRRGIETELYHLPTDHPWPVFMALGVKVDQSLDGPAVVVGLGADLEASKAAKQAILEIGQIRPALRYRMRQQENRERLDYLLKDPCRVAVLEDHDLLYATPQTIGAFNFIRSQPLIEFDWNQYPSLSTVDKLGLLLRYLKEQESGDLIYFNLTSSDMSPFDLYTVRAILPGFQPIHFGWKERRLAGKRLYEIPYKIGQRSAFSTPAEINLAPHPLP